MIITIGREHGSDGHSIARRLAQELNIISYSKEIVDEAAKNSQFSRDVLSSFDEKRVSTFIEPTAHFMGMYGSFGLSMQAANAQFSAIRAIADKGDCIFIGRCADYVLRNRDDLVSVFIIGDLDKRIANIAKRQGISEDQAKKLIRNVDKDRASYYKYYTDQIWGECENYDLCINSTDIGVEGAVNVIKAFIAAKKL